MSEDNSHPSRRELRERARAAEQARAKAAAEELAAADVARAAGTARRVAELDSADATGLSRRRVRLNHAADGPVDVPYIRASPQYFAPVANDGDAPVTRRTLRLQAHHQVSPAVSEPESAESGLKRPSVQPVSGETVEGADSASSVESVNTNSISLEQITAAREALAAQMLNQSAGIEAVRREDPNAISLREIQRHQELAAKAEVIEAQIRAREEAERLEAEAQVEAQQAERARTATPSDVDNLAMVTPLEFEKIPGSDRPVMKRPATSHVPVVTGTNQVSARRRTSRSPLTGRLKRVGAEQYLHTPPLEARDAHGLEPLAASERQPTSRTKFYVAQAVLLTLGLGTLVTGIILILQSMNR